MSPHEFHPDGSVTLDISLLPVRCMACDTDIQPHAPRVQVWCEFERQITTGSEIGLPPINGVWEQRHPECVKPGERVKDD